MIREINFQAATRVLEQLDSKLVFGVVPETPLAHLASMSVPAFDIAEGTDIAKAVRGIVNQSEGSDDHSHLMDVSAKAISDAVGRQMRFTRNVVLPAVSQIVSSISNTIGEREPTPWSITSIDFSALVESEAVRSLVDRWAGADDGLHLVVDSFPELTDEVSLLALLETGSQSANQMILDLIATKPTGWVLSVYEQYFRGKANADDFVYDNMRRKAHRAVASSSTKLGDSDALAIALILAMNMSNGDPLPNAQMSLSEYRRLCAQVQNTTASQLSSCYKAYEKFLTTEVLIISTGMTKNLITVFGPVYRKFLESNTVEVIVGYALLNPSANRVTAQVVLQDAQQATLRYSRWLATFDGQRDERLIGTIPQLVVKEVSDYIRSMTDDINCCNRTQDEMIYTLVDCVKHIDPKLWLNQLYPTVRKIMGDAIWPGHSAVGILEAIDQLSETLGQDIEPRVLAYHAIRRLVVAHIASMFTVDAYRG